MACEPLQIGWIIARCVKALLQVAILNASEYQSISSSVSPEQG